MWLKICGAVIVIVSAWLLSVSLNRTLDEKLQQLEALTALIRYIRSQIDCFCTPVSEIIAKCDMSLLSRCGIVNTGADFSTLVDNISPVPDVQTAKVLTSFCSELGATYRDEQIKSCDYHISALSAIRAPMTEDIKKRKKLNTVLCLSVAGVAVILFI